MLMAFKYSPYLEKVHPRAARPTIPTVSQIPPKPARRAVRVFCCCVWHVHVLNAREHGFKPPLLKAGGHEEMPIYHGVYSYCDNEDFWGVMLGLFLEIRKLGQSPHAKLKETSPVDAKGNDDREKTLRTSRNRHYMAAIRRKMAGWPKPEEASSHLEDSEINTDEQRGQRTAGQMRERTLKTLVAASVFCMMYARAYTTDFTSKQDSVEDGGHVSDRPQGLELSLTLRNLSRSSYLGHGWNLHFSDHEPRLSEGYLDKASLIFAV